jgi:hypothetical protein
MLRNKNRGSMGFGLPLVLGLALMACVQSTSNAPGSAGTAGSTAKATTPAGNGMTTTGAPAASATAGNGPGKAGSAAQTTNPDRNVGQPSAGSGAAGTTSGSSSGPGGSTASAGGGGQAGSDVPADAGTMTTPHGDLGKGDGSDVVTIGDSWMSIVTNGGGIEGALDRAGTAYRHYAVPGTTLIGGDIPLQYGRAKAANPKIATVIMTGGGNDVMFSNGCATKESCTMAVQAIVDALDQLWSQMADDGVKDVIFIQYSKNAGTSPSDTRPDTAPIPTICTTGRITCHSIDTTPFVGPTDTIDGIHPTLPACDMIAKAVLDMMQMQGIRR